MIKLARKYSFDKYGEGRNKIITLKQSFHGRTVTTLKATGQDKFHQYFFPFTEGFDYAAANDIEDMKRKIDDTTCAVMMEMIRGEGGVLPLDKEFVQATAEICKEKDILLPIDEVRGRASDVPEACSAMSSTAFNRTSSAWQKDSAAAFRSVLSWRIRNARMYWVPVRTVQPSAAIRSAVRLPIPY